MPNYRTLIFAVFVLSFCLLGVQDVGATSPDDARSLFTGEVSGDYLCTPGMTRRYPERCPSLSPGARDVRLEYLRTRLPHPLPPLPMEEMEVPEEAVSEYTFAYVRELPAPTYAHPAEAETDVPPKRVFEAGTNWVSVGGRTDYNGEAWYEINEGEFIRAAHLAIASPSRFHGVILSEQPSYPFAWINRAASPSPLPGDPPGATTLHRYEMVTLFAQEMVNGSLWYLIGPEQWIDQSFVSRVDVDPRPEGVGADERWLEVDTFEQTLAAYEGDRMVFATLISSGRSESWTPDGLTRIWAKLPTTPMSNKDVEPSDPSWYYLEDVEWTQYFYQDYAIHAAYWHDAFAFTRSHGCVNLAPLDAKWLFDWTSPRLPEGAIGVYAGERYGEGTWVWVHKSEPVPGYSLN